MKSLKSKSNKVFQELLWYLVIAPSTVSFLTGITLSLTTFSIANLLSMLGANLSTKIAIVLIADLVIAYQVLPSILTLVYFKKYTKRLLFED